MSTRTPVTFAISSSLNQIYSVCFQQNIFSRSTLFHYLIIFIGFTSFLSLANPPATIYKTIKSELYGRIILAPAGEIDYYYINYQGFNSEFDNKTLLYKKRKNDFGDKFHFALVGTSRTNLIDHGHSTLIFGTTVPYKTVRLEDNIMAKVVFAGYASPQQVRQLKQKYNKLQGLEISKVATKKSITSAHQQLNKQCNKTFQLAINWHEFEPNHKATPGMLVPYLNALGEICLRDQDYLDAVQQISQINLHHESGLKQPRIKLEKGTLQISLNNRLPNVFETSLHTVLDLL